MTYVKRNTLDLFIYFYLRLRPHMELSQSLLPKTKTLHGVESILSSSSTLFCIAKLANGLFPNVWRGSVGHGKQFCPYLTCALFVYSYLYIVCGSYRLHINYEGTKEYSLRSSIMCVVPLQKIIGKIRRKYRQTKINRWNYMNKIIIITLKLYYYNYQIYYREQLIKYFIIIIIYLF